MSVVQLHFAIHAIGIPTTKIQRDFFFLVVAPNHNLAYIRFRSIDNIPQQIAGGVREETKKDTLDRIRKELGRPTTGRSNPDATTEGANVQKIINFPKGKRKRRGCLISRGERVVNTKPVLKSIGPEADVGTSTSKECTYGVGDSEMGTFDRTVLMRGVGTGRMKGVAELGKKRANLGVSIELTALVKVHILVRTCRGMFAKESSQPLNRGGLRDASDANFKSGEVIRDENPTGLTIEANVFGATSSVGRLNTRKREVDGNPNPNSL